MLLTAIAKKQIRSRARGRPCHGRQLALWCRGGLADSGAAMGPWHGAASDGPTAFSESEAPVRASSGPGGDLVDAPRPQDALTEPPRQQSR
jgi:hypothetical protein